MKNTYKQKCHGTAIIQKHEKHQQIDTDIVKKHMRCLTFYHHFWVFHFITFPIKHTAGRSSQRH